MRPGNRSEGNSRSGSVQGRRSADFMGITEEEEEEDIEEVDDFSAVMKPGEYVDDPSSSQPDGVEKPLPSQRGKGLGIS